MASSVECVEDETKGLFIMRANWGELGSEAEGACVNCA